MARSTLDAIYYGAIEAFSEKGYNDTSMDYVAEKAGVAKGTLYYNFKGKDELFLYVMKRGAHSLTDVITNVFDQPADPVTKWRNYISTQLAFFEQNRSFFRLIMQNMWGPNLLESVTLHELFHDYFVRMDQELQKAQELGLLSESMDISTLSASIFGMLTIPAIRSIVHDLPIDEEKRVNSITHTVLQSFKGGETI
ncbi:TetR/AcrR family transcriptional regulator [Ammoniphilus resinae]|uniref:AcrR family transcriptional regulator n=1 Tax=Ammoniphilus resinae TaxID=861532 RepID=A0ABS4GV35_9BACL|nr:TetR/AcrR family transcriptional regulator [Ammoniphilus resinae]MBP1934129.1 AcrR family transcriptional regulator [Ammoniphilus resinae]